MEKREMLLLFYEKQRYDNVQVPKKFFEQGLNSDLYEMRWWYYKLIRDTRINDAVSSMKHNIVQGMRMALFLNNAINNPLNLRLDNDFPDELGNRLNTSTDRHLREYIKSKCGVGGPKPNPVRHIVQDIFECGWNYHRNKMAMEENEKRKNERRNNGASSEAAPPASRAESQFGAAPPAPNAYNMLREMAGAQSTPVQQPYNSAQQAQYERFLAQQRMMQQQQEQAAAMIQQQQQQQQTAAMMQARQQQRAPSGAPPVFQPDRQPLRSVFRNMSPAMRRAPLPDYLRPPTPRMSASESAQQVDADPSLTGTQSLAAAARAMREQIHAQTSRTGAETAARQHRPPQPEKQPVLPPRNHSASAPRLQQPKPMALPSLVKKKAPNGALNRPALQPPGAERQQTVPLPPTQSIRRQQQQRFAGRHALAQLPPRTAPGRRPPTLPTLQQPHEPLKPPQQPPNLFQVAQSTAHAPLRPLSSSSSIATSALRRATTSSLNNREAQRIATQFAPTRQNSAHAALHTTAPYDATETTFVESVRDNSPLTQQLETHRAQRQRQMEFDGETTAVNADAAAADAMSLAARSNQTTSVGGGKRSLDDLMSELRQAYDEDDASETLHDADLSREAALASGMPEMNTQDNLTNALGLMENFNNGNVQNASLQQRPTLYDLDDILAEQAEAAGAKVEVNELSLGSLRRSVVGSSQSGDSSSAPTSRRGTSRKGGNRRRKRLVTKNEAAAEHQASRSVTPPPSQHAGSNEHQSTANAGASTPPPTDAALMAGGVKMVAQHKRGRSGFNQFQWSSSPNAGRTP